jgi:type II secretory pathway pseudopilin PulG
MRAKRGTTLIEAMIAIAVLATGVAGVAAAMIATAGQDRRNAARAAAMTVATDTAQALAREKFANLALFTTANYINKDFGAPKVAGATQVPGPPPVATDIWAQNVNAPSYNDGNLAALPGVRSHAELNRDYPGKLYVFNRYWNVMIDPTNPYFKIIAVHVTYNSGSKVRAVASVYTSVFDEPALTKAFTND